MSNKKTAYQRTVDKVASIVPAKFRPFFLHPAGPTTVFFWAPMIKWCLVIANIGDLKRPADKISLRQTASLMLTGATWCRYSVVIIPKNYNLLSVNAFVLVTSSYLFAKGFLYHMQHSE